MKKIALATLAVCLLMSSAYASQQITAHKAMGFAPIGWQSANSNDVITIQNGMDSGSYNVLISVANDGVFGLPPLTGINIKNCGSVTHINLGSSAVCQLSTANPTISFSSDKEDATAMGVYQIG